MGALALTHSKARPAELETVRAMLAASPHRGADSDVRSLGRTAVGVVNHAGLRDSWVTVEDGIVAAFSGSLDNARELAEALTRAGVPPQANDPASLVAAAHRAWGEDAPSRLRGSFAAAVSDGARLTCFRDHLGFRGFFFRDDEETFLAASEPKQVAAGAGIQREPDLDAVEATFYLRLPERRTALRGVERLPKASVAEIDGGSASVRRYWEPERLLESADLGVDDAIEQLRALLALSVGRAVEGNDVISLSGGLDSPAVAAFAAPRHRELAGRPLRALSAVYPDQPSVDERRYVELVSAHLGLELSTYVQRTRPLESVERWVDLFDGPWDTLPIPEAEEHYRLAAELGARNVLTGELIEFAATRRDNLLGHLVFHGRLRAASAHVRLLHSRGRGWRSILRFAAPSLVPGTAGRVYARARRRTLRKRDLAGLAPWLDAAKFGGLGHRPVLALPARRRWAEAQLAAFRPGVVTSFEADDLCAAICGVRVRRPLADVDLWEFLLSLPAEVKFPDLVTKSLIRRSVEDLLPHEIVYRKDKTVFNEHALDTADYEGLERLVCAPTVFRMPGVDYDVLAERVRRRELAIHELLWAYNLARAHAFVNLWA